MRFEIAIDELVLVGTDRGRHRATADAIAAALRSPSGLAILRAAVASWQSGLAARAPEPDSRRERQYDLSLAAAGAIGRAVGAAVPRRGSRVRTTEAGRDGR